MTEPTVALEAIGFHPGEAPVPAGVAYVSIGNSDDSLSQKRWAQFTASLTAALRMNVEEIHGEWYSAPDAPYQNMCVCIEYLLSDEEELKGSIRTLAKAFGQESIVWFTETSGTRFLSGDPVSGDQVPHDYTSTSCLHELHARCRLNCKFCQAGCACACHAPGSEPV
jgi:hypothetical protein